jgi:tRNA 2-thiouridine synthesizing protein A
MRSEKEDRFMALFGFKDRKETAKTATVRQVTLGDGTALTVARQVDCLGDSCPRPQLMTKKALGDAAIGDVIEVMVDNPSSVEALPPLCAELGATHLETRKAERCWQVFIRKD